MYTYTYIYTYTYTYIVYIHIYVYIHTYIYIYILNIIYSFRSETITRAKFEELCSDLFRKTMLPVERVLEVIYIYIKSLIHRLKLAQIRICTMIG